LQKIHCGLILQNISIEWPIFDNIFLKNDRLNKLKKMLLKKKSHLRRKMAKIAEMLLRIERV